MPFLEIGKHRLSYRLKRDGPESFVFIHGLGASKNSFEACFAMDVFRGYTLAALDLPGCGESGWSGGFSYTMKAHADLVLKWIEVIALDRLVLVGHSMGGVISLYLAETLGSRVKVFFNLEGNLVYQDCTYSSKIASGTEQYFEGKGVEQFKNKLKETLRGNPSPGLRNYYDNISRAYPRALYLSSVSLVKESCKGDLKARFASLPVKKWYAFGEKSINHSIRSFLDAKKIPYFIVPESGHFMMDDQPDFFYRMLFEALEGKKPRGASL